MSTNKQALREAAEKATPGPWRAFRYDSGICGVGGGESFEVMVCERISSQRPEDSKFIAAANPATVLELLAEMEAAEKRIAELEAREVKVRQFSEFQICHYGAAEDYAKGYIDCQKNYNKGLAAAGITVKGE